LFINIHLIDSGVVSTRRGSFFGHDMKRDGKNTVEDLWEKYENVTALIVF